MVLFSGSQCHTIIWSLKWNSKFKFWKIQSENYEDGFWSLFILICSFLWSGNDVEFRSLVLNCIELWGGRIAILIWLIIKRHHTIMRFLQSIRKAVIIDVVNHQNCDLVTLLVKVDALIQLFQTVSFGSIDFWNCRFDITFKVISLGSALLGLSL